MMNPIACLILLSFAVVYFCSSSVCASSAAGTETLVGIVGKDFVLLGADSSVSQSIALTASNLDKIAVVAEPFPCGRPSEAEEEQQTIAAAAAGDAADADRLLSLLTAHAAIREFEMSVGCDVDFVDCSGSDGNHDTPSLLTTPAGLSVEAVARLARSQIIGRLRSSTPLRVCLLVAGMMQVKDRLVNPLLSPVGSSNGAEQVQLQVKRASEPFLYPAGEPPASEERTATSSSKLNPRLYWLDEYGSLQKIQYGAHGFGSNFILSILDQGYRPDLTSQEAVALLHDCFAQLRTRYVINSPQPPCIKCIDAQGCRIIR